MIADLYCNCTECKHNSYGRCSLDFVTIDSQTTCMGFEEKDDSN